MDSIRRQAIEKLTYGFIGKDNDLSMIWYRILELAGWRGCGIDCECKICDIMIIDELVAKVYIKNTPLEVYLYSSNDEPGIISIIIDNHFVIRKYVKHSWYECGKIIIDTLN